MLAIQSMKRCAFYSSLKTENGSRAALVVLDLNNHKYDLRPFFCERLTSVSGKSPSKKKALAAINGGFFNLNNGESTSYIVIDGKEKNAIQNTIKALVENPALKSSLENHF